VAAPPSTASFTKSGLASVVLKPCRGGKKPQQQQIVHVHYTGWTSNGFMFDTSVGGDPAHFPLSAVIPGWSEAVQLMCVGERRRVWVPASLAYGDHPARPGAPAGQLTFEIELLGIDDPVVVATPSDVSAPPSDAKRTASGVSYRVLHAGTGNVHPGPSSRVRVHYSGWTTDGKMFDSSRVRGNEAVFGLQTVIKGWAEGVQLMVEGEETRFWIPSALAYGDHAQGGRPTGMLVFDIELIKILE
jgi:peptidylprolyl isomerase